MRAHKPTINQTFFFPNAAFMLLFGCYFLGALIACLSEGMIDSSITADDFFQNKSPLFLIKKHGSVFLPIIVSAVYSPCVLMLPFLCLHRGYVICHSADMLLQASAPLYTKVQFFLCSTAQLFGIFLCSRIVLRIIYSKKHSREKTGKTRLFAAVFVITFLFLNCILEFVL